MANPASISATPPPKAEAPISPDPAGIYLEALSRSKERLAKTNLKESPRWIEVIYGTLIDAKRIDRLAQVSALAQANDVELVLAGASKQEISKAGLHKSIRPAPSTESPLVLATTWKPADLVIVDVGDDYQRTCNALTIWEPVIHPAGLIGGPGWDALGISEAACAILGVVWVKAKKGWWYWIKPTRT